MICIQLCAQNSYHMTERYTSEVPFCYVIIVHHCSGSQPVLANRSASFNQNNLLPPMSNHKINKNAWSYERDYLKSVDYFQSFKNIFSLPNCKLVKPVWRKCHWIHCMRGKHIIFLTWQVSTTTSWRPTLINHLTVIVIKVERLMRRALIKIYVWEEASIMCKCNVD